MGSVTTSVNSGNSQFNNYDTSKLFLRDNLYEKGSYTNDEYEDSPLAMGTLMGRVATTGKLVPLKSGASDGSQFPVGILAENYEVDGGDTIDVSICIAGEVDKSLVVLDPGDSLETVISSRRIKDRIASDTVGIKLVKVDQLTDFDNS